MAQDTAPHPDSPTLSKGHKNLTTRELYVAADRLLKGTVWQSCC